MFEEDQFETPPTVKLEAYYPIRGAFSAQMKGLHINNIVPLDLDYMCRECSIPSLSLTLELLLNYTLFDSTNVKCTIHTVPPGVSPHTYA